MNKAKEALLLAYEKGYRVTKNGDVLNPNGILIKSTRKKGDDYRTFGIKIEKTYTYKVKVHRLLGYQKFGDKIFEDDIHIRHLNGDYLDNTYDNIGIGTPSENMMDISEEVRLKTAMNATSYVRKYDKEEVIKFYNKVKSYALTMREFKISSKGTLHFILNK
jgi:hypothetical protein